MRVLRYCHRIEQNRHCCYCTVGYSDIVGTTVQHLHNTNGGVGVCSVVICSPNGREEEAVGESGGVTLD